MTGASGAVVFEVEALTHPWLFLLANDDGIVAIHSSETGQEIFTQTGGAVPGLGFDGDDWLRAGAVSPDTRTVYYTGRNQPAIAAFDTVKHALTYGPSLIGGASEDDGTGAVGSLSGLVTSPDGAHLFTTVSHGGHTGHFNGSFAFPPRSRS